jgi:hypothetical protein
MRRGRSGPSLGERAANSGVSTTATPSAFDATPRPAPASSAIPAAGPAYAAAGEGGEGRHCWVRDPPEAPGTWPGLLVEWRRRAGSWQGRVAYTVTGPHGPALIESWLPAARLEPR